MTTATVSSKGQLTIPSDVRLALGVEPGDRIEFVQVRPGEFLVTALNRSVTELKGMFGKPEQPVSIADMNRAISAEGSGGGGS
jgi:AbrB family looped-hinge helix DNA binding protein